MSLLTLGAIPVGTGIQCIKRHERRHNILLGRSLPP